MKELSYLIIQPPKTNYIKHSTPFVIQKGVTQYLIAINEAETEKLYERE